MFLALTYLYNNLSVLKRFEANCGKLTFQCYLGSMLVYIYIYIFFFCFLVTLRFLSGKCWGPMFATFFWWGGIFEHKQKVGSAAPFRTRPWFQCWRWNDMANPVVWGKLVAVARFCPGWFLVLLLRVFLFCHFPTWNFWMWVFDARSKQTKDVMTM